MTGTVTDTSEPDRGQRETGVESRRCTRPTFPTRKLRRKDGVVRSSALSFLQRYTPSRPVLFRPDLELRGGFRRGYRKPPGTGPILSLCSEREFAVGKRRDDDYRHRSDPRVLLTSFVSERLILLLLLKFQKRV